MKVTFKTELNKFMVIYSDACNFWEMALDNLRDLLHPYIAVVIAG